MDRHQITMNRSHWRVADSTSKSPAYALRKLTIGAAALVLVVSIASVQAAEQPVAAEHNPPGDIPDTQVFVTYESPLGFAIKVPEGWARVVDSKSVRFSDKYNTIEVVVSPLDAAPTPDSVKVTAAPELQRVARAIELGKIEEVTLSGGPAILITYASNSEPNSVTNKQIRLEHDRYLFYKDHKLASLDMSAPLGSDNIDVWSLMANAFEWK